MVQFKAFPHSFCFGPFFSGRQSCGDVQCIIHTIARHSFFSTLGVDDESSSASDAKRLPPFLFFSVTQGAATGGGDGERKGWLVLEGTIGPNGKVAAAVGETQLKVLRAAREEVLWVLLEMQFFSGGFLRTGLILR